MSMRLDLTFEFREVLIDLGYNGIYGFGLKKDIVDLCCYVFQELRAVVSYCLDSLVL